MITLPRPINGLALSLAALLLIACQAPGGSEGGAATGPGAGIIAASAKKLDDGAPFHVDATTIISGSDPKQANMLRIDTVGDIASPTRARLQLSSPQQPDTKFDMVLYDEDLFARPTGGEWEQMPAAQIAQLGPSPLDTIAFLKGITGQVEDKGKEDVKGASARRFTAALDIPSLVAQMDKLGRPMAPDMLKSARLEVWITEADSLVRRSKVSMDLTDAGGGGSLELDSYATDHGKPVDIQKPSVPPASPFSISPPGASPSTP